MGCHGSKTAQPSKPVEQHAADTTLLKEPVADSQIVKPQESRVEAPQALVKETSMDASPDAAAPLDEKIGTTQDAETSKAAETQDAETSKFAETSAIQDATALNAAEAPTLPVATASKAEEAQAIEKGAISKDVVISEEMEAAGATPPDAVNKLTAGVAVANDEVNGGKQIPTAEASEQKLALPEPKDEAGAATATPVQDPADEGASADQAKVAGLAVHKVAADPTATSKPVAIGAQGGCCSRYCLATEVQSEIVAQRD